MTLGVRTWGNSPDGATVILGTYQDDGEVSGRLLRALPPPSFRVTRGAAR